MNPWTQHFTPASWSGGSWGSGDLTVGDLAPSSLILHLVRGFLAESAVLQKVFSGRIEALDVRNPFDFRDLPRLQVYLGSVRPDGTVATGLTLETVTVYVGIRYSVEDAVNVLDFGEPTIACVWREIVKILNSKKQLIVNVPGNPSVPLADRRHGQQEGTFSYLIDPNPDSAGSPAVTQELQWSYGVTLDFTAQQFKSLT